MCLSKSCHLILALLLVGCQRSTPPERIRDVDKQPQAPVHLDPKLDASEASSQLLKSGFGPKKPATVVFFTVFTERSRADAAASTLKTESYEVDVHKSEPTGDWIGMAMKSLSPGTPEFGAAFEHVAAVAEKSGGQYDGWGLDSD